MPQLCCSSATVRNLRSIRRLRALRLSGKDATEDFEDVGHSDEARSMMAEKNDSGIKIVGTIEGEVPESMKAKKSEDVRSACMPCQLSGPLPSPFDLVTAAAPHPSALCDAPLRNPLRCSVVRRCAVPCRPGLPATPHILRCVHVSVPPSVGEARAPIICRKAVASLFSAASTSCHCCCSQLAH